MTIEISQKDRVAIVVRHTPNCVLRDVCEALDIPSGTAGKFLRALTLAAQSCVLTTELSMFITSLRMQNYLT